MASIFVAVLSVGLTYGWLYFVATHGPRLLGQSVAWFDGEPALGARLRVGAISTGLALLSCFALGVVVCFAMPSEHPTTRVTVLPDSPADRAGVRNGDVIVAIDSQRIESFDQVVNGVASSAGPLRLEVLRENTALQIEVTPEDQRLGVQSVMEKKRRTVSQAFEFCAVTFGRSASSLLPTQSTFRLSGPVSVIRETSKGGAGSFLFLFLLLQAGVWLIVPLLHILDLLTLILSRGRSSRSPLRRDVFNLLSLGASLLVLSVWGSAQEWQSDAASLSPLLGFSTKVWGLALSLASFTALKRHLPLQRAGALALVGALVGPILWIGTFIWIRRQARAASEKRSP